MISSNGKFEILENSTDDDSYMYSDTSYHYIVASIKTGDSIKEYSGRWDEDSHGATKSGVESLTFSPTSDKVIIHNFDGTVEEFILPLDINIIDEGRVIALIWPDGRVEKRKRVQAGFTTKYGEPFLARKLVDEYKGPDPEPTDPDFKPKEGDRFSFKSGPYLVYERILPNREIQYIDVLEKKTAKELKKATKKSSKKSKGTHKINK
jgi:hypothetical protein